MHNRILLVRRASAICGIITSLIVFSATASSAQSRPADPPPTAPVTNAKPGPNPPRPKPDSPTDVYAQAADGTTSIVVAGGAAHDVSSLATACTYQNYSYTFEAVFDLRGRDMNPCGSTLCNTIDHFSTSTMRLSLYLGGTKIEPGPITFTADGQGWCWDISPGNVYHFRYQNASTGGVSVTGYGTVTN